jgi:hypothetical protein
MKQIPKNRPFQTASFTHNKKLSEIAFEQLLKNKMVRTRRIELPLPRGNRLLRPARLPVPPRPHV